jgi:hypothetical protein
MLQSSRSGAWTLLGDFSLTRSPDDRSNDNFDHQEADWFNGALESKAKTIDQSKRTVQPHMDQRAHQDMQPN